MTRILVAGVGNALRGDDGFGVAVMRELAHHPLGAEVTRREYGIGGIHLVQELMRGYGALVLVDAVERGSAAGTLHLLEPQVPALEEMAPAQRRDFLADMHWADPTRALILAKALGVLPPRVLIVGCQPGETEQVSLALSPAVAGAVPRALHMIDQALERLR